MTFLVTGVSGQTQSITDCESASEAMEVFRAEFSENVISVELLSLTSFEEDNADGSFG